MKQSKRAGAAGGKVSAGKGRAEISSLFDSIFPGNCTEVLQGLPEASVDVIFADPPYNLQLRNDLFRPNLTKVAAVQDSWDKFSSFEKYDEFTRGWLSACRRVLKDSGTIWVIGSYHNIYRVGAIMQDLGFWILNDVIWIKSNPMPNFRGVRFTNAHETMIWAQKKQGVKYIFNHRTMKALNDDLQMRSDWNLPLATGPERVKSNGTKAHSTQKPEALLYRVLMAASQPGDLVLDPFFGTGTTGVMARKLGRNYICIECEDKYIQIARKRIAAVSRAPAQSLAVEPQRPPRVPFGALVENGLLKPGQTLYLSGNGIKATILANGHIRCNGVTGSIHGVAKSLLGAPANGWDVWYYKDLNGKKKVIDELREKIRERMKA